jgi:hypothetical protein
MSRIYIGMPLERCCTFRLRELTSLKEIEVVICLYSGMVPTDEKAFAKSHFKGLSVTLHWVRDFGE